MIKLKQLLTEAEHINEKFLWLNPEGLQFQVPTEGHGAWAADYLSKTLPTRKAPNDVYGEMYKLGWLRVSIFGYLGVNGVHFNTIKGKRPNQAQRDTMIELAKQYHATEIIDDTNGGVYLDVM